MGVVEWAEKEIALAKEDADEYYSLCCDSAIKALKRLAEDEHSGFSIGVTMGILKQLVERKPLTEITGNDDEWGEDKYGAYKPPHKEYQNKRYSALFKSVYPDGHIEYFDVDRVRIHELNTDTFWQNGFMSRLVNEMFPIAFPYFPPSPPYYVNVREYLFDPKMGDYDTVHVISIITPEGETVPVNRYFKESESGFDEITDEEFKTRINDKKEESK